MRVRSRSFLLGLMVIVHLQSCVDDVNAVRSCCFSFHSSKIPLTAICKYENVHRGCPKSGVIFTVRKSRVCADPNQSWVKRAMNEIDQRLSKSAKVLRGRKTEADTHPAPTTMKPHTSTVLRGRKTEADTHPAPTTMKPHTSTVLRGRKTEARVLLKPDPSTTQHQHEPEAETRPEPTTPRSGPHTDPHEHEAQTQAAPETSRSDPAEPTWFCYV